MQNLASKMIRIEETSWEIPTASLLTCSYQLLTVVVAAVVTVSHDSANRVGPNRPVVKNSSCLFVVSSQLQGK